VHSAEDRAVAKTLQGKTLLLVEAYLYLGGSPCLDNQHSGVHEVIHLPVGQAEVVAVAVVVHGWLRMPIPRVF